ncbi:hypothetical protein [Deinococcus navajonensis]|uniref:Uncharacterized protein n=1 Tax=Deinococcus navajonensis TaxID=309884 RepID=A0ABV8XIG5_9DEIO
MKTPPPTPPHGPLRWPQWQARLIALPGVLTLLSVLAVILGTPAPAVDATPRMTSSSVAPGLPELRPAPQPAPQTPLPAPPVPEPWRLVRGHERSGPVQGRAEAWQPRPDPIVWGRLQTDGG